MQNTYRVGDSVLEPNELNLTFFLLPMREQRQNKSETGGLGVGGVV